MFVTWNVSFSVVLLSSIIELLLEDQSNIKKKMEIESVSHGVI